MTSLPTNVSTGLVTGRFIAGVVDGPDADAEPDVIPASGTVTFSASVPYLPNPTADPDAVTIIPVSIQAAIDQDGYLKSPMGARGVRLIATDDPDLLVSDWTWQVSYKFNRVNGALPVIPDHSMLVPSDGEIDLTTAVKVPASPGIGTNQIESYTLRAESLQTQALDIQGELLDLWDILAPETESVTVSSDGVIPRLGNFNRWIIDQAVTLELPTEVPQGSTYLVEVNNIQNITWPSGVVTIGGTSSQSGQAIITLINEGLGWTAIISSGGGTGSGLPEYDSAHPLFAAGNGAGGSLAHFNDFFGLSLTSVVHAAGMYPFIFAGSGLGMVWWDKVSLKWRWGTMDAMLRSAALNQHLKADATTGQITATMAGAAPSSGVAPYINTAFLPFLTPTDWRNATTSPAPMPTAVTNPAALSTYAGDSNIPIGVSTLVVSINKPVWKTASGVFRDAAAVQIWPVP